MKRLRNMSYIVFIVAIALSILLPGSVSAASKTKPKPVISNKYVPGKSEEHDFFISQNGVLINIATLKEVKGEKVEITAVTSNGKITKWSEKGPDGLQTIYAKNDKGKEVIYVYNYKTQKLKALDMSLKKRWEIKAAKEYDGYNYNTRQEDSSFWLNYTEKITIDGKRAKINKDQHLVKRIGKYEYRVNENNQTYQKTDKETGEVIWTKRAFDLKDKDGKTLAAHSVRLASLDNEGNAFATAGYPGNEMKVVAVSNDGEVLWHTDGFINPGQVFVEHLYYCPVVPPPDGYVGDYTITIANKYTGKRVKTYGPINPYVGFDFIIQQDKLYVIDETFAEALDGKGKRIFSYKSPKNRRIFGYDFDNKHNFYIQSGYNPGTKGQNGWIFIYSDKGKLIGKKKFDQENYSKFLVDPTGKQHYQVKYIHHKNFKSSSEIYKYK